MNDDPSTSELSEVDEALQAAQKDPNQANEFYDTFLNADIFYSRPCVGQEGRRLETA